MFIFQQKQSMSCADLLQTYSVLFLASIAASQDSPGNGDLHLTCGTFTDNEQTSCSCVLPVVSDFDTLKLPKALCDSQNMNAIYIIKGKELRDDESFDTFSHCLCCYTNILTGELRYVADKETPTATCEVKDLLHNGQAAKEVVVKFQALQAVHKGDYVSCNFPCLPGQDSLIMNFTQKATDLPTVSLMVIVTAAVGSTVVVLVLGILLVYQGIKYQRKQAWVIKENRQSRPPPLPTLQNSGLRYMVDDEGNVVPAEILSEEEKAGNKKHENVQPKYKKSEIPENEIDEQEETASLHVALLSALTITTTSNTQILPATEKTDPAEINNFGSPLGLQENERISGSKQTERLAKPASVTKRSATSLNADGKKAGQKVSKSRLGSDTSKRSGSGSPLTVVSKTSISSKSKTHRTKKTSRKDSRTDDSHSDDQLNLTDLGFLKGFRKRSQLEDEITKDSSES